MNEGLSRSETLDNWSHNTLAIISIFSGFPFTHIIYIITHMYIYVYMYAYTHIYIYTNVCLYDV